MMHKAKLFVSKYYFTYICANGATYHLPWSYMSILSLISKHFYAVIVDGYLMCFTGETITCIL